MAAASLQGLKELLNHAQGVEDEFQHRPRPIGYWAARTQALMASVGLGILIFGALTAL